MNNRKCPNCQLINRGDAAQCERCGSPLTDEHNMSDAYAPGDLGAQSGAASEPYTQGEAPGAAGIGESYRWGASRWLRVTLGLVLAWLAAFSPMLLAGIFVGMGAAAQSSALMAVAFLSFLVLLIPCIIVSLGFSLVTPVAAL